MFRRRAREYSAPELLRFLARDEDRVPRNVIDECARRGDEMVEHLAGLLQMDYYWGGDLRCLHAQHDWHGTCQRRIVNARICEVFMHMAPMDSSAIAAERYDAAKHTLRLQYRNGRVYDYFGVPPAVYQEFLEAESAGEFVNLHIKPFYPYSEVE